MVSQHCSKLLKTSLDLFIPIFHNNQLLIRFHIRTNRSGSHMGFIPKYCISNIIIMRNLHFIKEHRILKLCGVSHNCAFANNGLAADKGTVTYLPPPYQ